MTARVEKKVECVCMCPTDVLQRRQNLMGRPLCVRRSPTRFAINVECTPFALRAFLGRSISKPPLVSPRSDAGGATAGDVAVCCSFFKSAVFSMGGIDAVMTVGVENHRGPRLATSP